MTKETEDSDTAGRARSRAGRQIGAPAPALQFKLPALVPAMALAPVMLLAAGQAAIAQSTDEEDEIVLERIIVTAGRTPVEERKTGRAYTVIDGAQLERSQVRNVADALRQVPGFHVSRTGALGGQTSIRVRGAEANHVLVLIDGVEVSATGEGEYDLGGLIATDIERIEVLRGPQSALFGSDAMAGVINIITKRGKRDSLTAGYQVEYGSDNTKLLSGNVRGGGRDFDASLSATKRVTDGFNISDFGSEEDGDRNLTLNGRFNWDIAPGLAMDGTLRFVNRENDTDDQPFLSPVLDTDSVSALEEMFGSLGLTYETPDGAWLHRARLTGTDVTRRNFENGAAVSGSQGVRTKAVYQITHRLDDVAGNRHSLTGAYEWEHETFKALPPVFDPSQLATQSRETHSFIGEYRGEFAGQFFLNAGIRQDNNDRFEDALTYSVAAAWAIPGTGTRLHGSFGTGVKNPTFYEQFGFIPASFQGNPNLTPESSIGWDIGVEQSFLDGAIIADVTYFRQNLENEIATDFSVFPFTAINLNGTSERHGWEVGLRAALGGGWSVSGTYTYVDSVDPNGARELRRPEHSGSLRVDYTDADAGHSLFAEAVFNGDANDTDFVTFNPVVLGSYTVVNAGGSYRVSDSLEIYARVENLLDEQYEEISGYNTQGRTAFVGIRGRF